MAIGHIAIRTHSRRRDHRAAAALAYRHGERIKCARTGTIDDYSRRGRAAEVLIDGIETARPTPLAGSLTAMAAGIEVAERRRDATILRDFQIALPHELDAAGRAALAREFAAELAERYDTLAAWAVHAPDARGDARNHHAHIVLPTRALDAAGDQLGAKLRVLDDRRTGPAEVAAIREMWAATSNRALEAAGAQARVHVGRTATPQATVGQAATAMEREAHPERTGSIAEVIGATPATRAGERLTRSRVWSDLVALPPRLVRPRRARRRALPPPEQAMIPVPEPPRLVRPRRARRRALPPPEQVVIPVPEPLPPAARDAIAALLTAKYGAAPRPPSAADPLDELLAAEEEAPQTAPPEPVAPPARDGPDDAPEEDGWEPPTPWDDDPDPTPTPW